MKDIFQPGRSRSSFKAALVKELQSLGLAVDVPNEEEEEVAFLEDSKASATDSIPSMDIHLSASSAATTERVGSRQ